MRNITPLPQDMPTDLNTVQGLINERMNVIEDIDQEIHAKRNEKRGIRDEVIKLQDAAKQLLGIRTRSRSKKDKPVAS